jgi:hypothetical protein
MKEQQKLEEFEERIRTGQIENMVSLAAWSLFQAAMASKIG